MILDKVKNLQTGEIETNMGISPLTDKVFFEKDLNDNKLYQLRVSYINNGLNISLIKEDISKQLKIENTFDLHDFIVNNIEHREFELNFSEDNHLVLPVLINSCCNQIAMCSRRGAGNIIVINEENLKYLEQNITFDNNGYDYQNTYIYAGRLNNSIKVYVDKTGNLSKDYIIITYNVTDKVQDNGISVVIDNNNNAYLQFLQNTSTTLGNWTDYYKVIKLKR